MQIVSENAKANCEPFPLDLAVITLALNYTLFTVLSRLSGDSLGVYTQIALRNGLAALIFWVVMRRAIRPFWKLAARDRGLILWRGLLLYVVSIPAFVASSLMLPLGVCSLIGALPFSLVCGALLFGDRMQSAEKIGMVVALLGLILLLGTDHSGASEGGLFSTSTAVGAGLALLSALTFGFFSTTRRSHTSDVRDAELCFYFLLMAGVVCGIVAMLPIGSSIASRAEYSSFGAAMLLQLIGAVLTVTSSLLLSRVYRSNQTARISLVLMTEPLFSAALGYLLFAETFSTLQLMGAGVMFCGLLAGAFGSALSVRIRSAAQVA